MTPLPSVIGPEAESAAPSRPRSKSGPIGKWRTVNWRTWRTRAGIGGLVLLLASITWWGPRLLSEFEYFRVRRVALQGVQFASPSELVSMLSLDSTASVWMPFEPLAERLTLHPMVDRAQISRRLPGTLDIRIAEPVPVAFVPTASGLTAADSSGRLLPIDPTVASLDLPVLASNDSLLLRFLSSVRTGAPALWARVAAAERPRVDEFHLTLDGVTVRTRADVTVARLSDILRVEADLAQRQLAVTEFDLRFRDQVIARLTP